MRKSILAIICLLMAYSSGAQIFPESYLGRLPGIPGGICEGDSIAHRLFLTRFSAVNNEVKAEILRRTEEMNARVNANETKMKANAIQQTGVSPEIAQKMMALEQKKKNAVTQAEKAAVQKEMKALADQMMQESMNMSMGEVKNLKNMDKAGKEAWGTAYATEIKAEVMAEPEKYQQQNEVNRAKADLIQNYTRLSDSLGAQKTRFLIMFRELDENKDAVEALQRITLFENELKDLQEKDPYATDKIESKMRQIYQEQKDYCNMQTNRYISIIGDFQSFVQSSMSDYYKLEDLNNQVAAAQTGVDLKPERGLMGLQVIEEYLGRLGDVYKYHIQDESYNVDSIYHNSGAEGN